MYICKCVKVYVVTIIFHHLPVEWINPYHVIRAYSVQFKSSSRLLIPWRQPRACASAAESLVTSSVVFFFSNFASALSLFLPSFKRNSLWNDDRVVDWWKKDRTTKTDSTSDSDQQRWYWPRLSDNIGRSYHSWGSNSVNYAILVSRNASRCNPMLLFWWLSARLCYNALEILQSALSHRFVQANSVRNGLNYFLLAITMTSQVTGVSIVCSTVCYRSKKISQLRVTALCEGHPPVAGGLPSQRASNAENVSIRWRHHITGFTFTPCPYQDVTG